MNASLPEVPRRIGLLLAVLGSVLVAPAWAGPPETSTPVTDPIYCVGHLNPDTDSIASALGAAFLYDGVAARTGEMNPESTYLLERFETAAPERHDRYAGKRVILLDHNQTTQAPDSMRDARIEAILDHHALRGSPYRTERPIRIDIRPWGSTCTLLADEMAIRGKAPDAALAGILLGGILSDTLILTSPTTTEHDRRHARALADRAGIADIEAFGRTLLEKKSQLDDLSDEQVLLLDFKEYVLAGLKIGFGVAETVDPAGVLAREPGLLAAMDRAKADRGLDHIFFAVVDVLETRSTLLTSPGPDRGLARSCFRDPDAAGRIPLDGFVSRKRQYIPALETHLESTKENGP